MLNHRERAMDMNLNEIPCIKGGKSIHTPCWEGECCELGDPYNNSLTGSPLASGDLLLPSLGDPPSPWEIPSRLSGYPLA